LFGFCWPTVLSNSNVRSSLLQSSFFFITGMLVSQYKTSFWLVYPVNAKLKTC
jgi:hypothetical protein